MKKHKKILLITAAALIVAGGVMAGIGIAAGGGIGFQITKSGIRTTKDAQGKFIEGTAELKGIEKLNIVTDDAKIEIVEGDDFKVAYGYFEDEQKLVESKDGNALALNFKQGLATFSIMSFGPISQSTETGYIKVYIPRGKSLDDINIVNEYGTVKVACDVKSRLVINGENASISVAGITVHDLQIGSNYGSLNLSDIKAETLEAKGENAEINLKNVEAKSAMVENQYGNIVLESIKADTLDVKSENGNITGEEVTAIDCNAKMQYGALVLKQFTVTNMEVESEVGEIQLDLMGREADYNMHLMTEYGEVKVNGKSVGDNFIRETNTENTLKLTSDNSKIKINTNEG